MGKTTRQDQASEILDRDREVGFSATIPVLGIPVTFESNAKSMIDVVEETFGAWRVLDLEPQLHSGEHALVRLFLREGEEGTDSHTPLHYRMPDPLRLIVSSTGSLGIADPARNEVVAYVTRGFLSDRDHFRYGMLEALTNALITRLDRQPLHAAALIRDGTALLLAGPSGVGKSTLCYVGLRAGLKILADDLVYLQSRPALRIWGMPGFLHLPLQARSHFPELARYATTLRANGKEKLAIDVREAGGVPELPVVEGVVICILSRGTGETRLTALSASEVEHALTSKIESGFDLFADTIGAAIHHMVKDSGGWQLTLGGAPQQAGPFLQEMLDRGSRGPGTAK